jgi:polyhydroxyalkanoate synthesis repressor PhaR
MSEEIIQIKRYPNRRFYDRNASKYISQEAIEELVRSGHKVEIRDSQAGTDITRSVLTRIILERQPDKMLLFPTDMLHFILRANEVSTGFLRDYFQHSLTYLDYLSRHSSATSKLARPMHWAKAWLDSIAPQQHENEAPPQEELDEKEDEAFRLARRVEELEKRIQQLESQGE